MARLIVIDASVAIAALAVDDIHHSAASAAISSAAEDEIVISATTRAEVLIGPARTGGKALAIARDFLDACVTVPVTAQLADDAALLRARHRALSLPDAISLVLADVIGADEIWTFDKRWQIVHPRVRLP